VQAQPMMQAVQIEKFARFLDKHPGVSPLLFGRSALVCGFQMGECFLAIDEMDTLIAAQPRADAGNAAPLPRVLLISKRRLP